MGALLKANRFTFLLGFVFLLGFYSCKKNNVEATDNNTGRTTTVPATGTRQQQTLDSLFLYAKQIYYWNDVIPEYSAFNPRQFTKNSADIDNLYDELNAFTMLKINPATGKAYEYYGDGDPKYSYISDLTEANPSASASINDKGNVDTEGNGNDVGIRPVFYTYRNSTAYDLIVTAVYPGSSAAKAGVQRGWHIQKINGSTVGANYNTESSMVTAAFDAASIKIEGVNSADQVPFSLTLTKTSYKSSPVYTSKVITWSGTKIGYLAYARFSVLSAKDGLSDTNLDPVFAAFSAAGVTNLILDLRYNGGGYINTAEYLANLIAPSALNNQVMFSEIYNATMKAGNVEILKNQPLTNTSGTIIGTYADVDYSVAGNTYKFAKKGPLTGVNRVVFIVGGNTASASELVINSLLSHPEVKVDLVGETTYGKPVGFFPITLQNRYEVWMASFETRNSANQGEYYTGMVPGTVVDDQSIYPFGDEREENLLAALNKIAPATVASKSASASIADRRSKNPSMQYSAKTPVHREFTGMIENRKKLK